MKDLPIIVLSFSIIVTAALFTFLHVGETVIGTHQRCSVCFQQPLFENIPSSTPYACDCETLTDYEQTATSKILRPVMLGFGLAFLIAGNFRND